MRVIKNYNNNKVDQKVILKKINFLQKNKQLLKILIIKHIVTEKTVQIIIIIYF